MSAYKDRKKKVIEKIYPIYPKPWMTGSDRSNEQTKVQATNQIGVRVTLRSRAETPELARIDFDQQIAVRFKYLFRPGVIEQF